MKLDLSRTIVALSSGVMPARRAIIRLSGSLTVSILQQLLRRAEDLRVLESKSACSAEVQAFVLWERPEREVCIPLRLYVWPDARSFTGEPSAELHLVGSMPVVEAVLAYLCKLGAEPAERGEFTLRSFLAGKLDLVQAESVLGVIEAEGEAQLNEALAKLGGNLSKPVRQMREQLIELVAHLEAGLDFVEEDIEFIHQDELVDQLGAIATRLETLASQLATRDARTSGAEVVIVGLPNSGKSSLFNYLVGSERTIVSDQAGTTRDVIAATIQIGGQRVELVDTAGIEELSGSSPRAVAQEALRGRIRRADLALFCLDCSQSIDIAWFHEQFAALQSLGVTIVSVGTKSDLASQVDVQGLHLDATISVRAQRGVDDLQRIITERIATHVGEFQSAAMHHLAIRCRQSLDAACSTIHRAIELARNGDLEELVAAELRLGLDDLSAIIGEVHSDDILGEIFSRFCIGK